MRNPPLLTMLETFSIMSLISMLFVSLLLKWLYNLKTNTKNHPPSPPKLPFIGNLHQLGNLAHRSLRSLAQKHGPIMLLHFARTPTLVISSAKAASEIMKTQDITFADRPVRKFIKKLMYNGKGVPFAPYGELWRQMKSIYMLQLLNNKKVESFRRVREEEVSRLMKKIEQLSSESLPVNSSEMLGSLTNNVISRAAFSRRHGEGENGEKFKQLLRDYLRLLGRFHVGGNLPTLSWVSRVNGFEAEVERVAREIDEFLEGVIKERIEGKVEDEDREDFLDILLKIYKGETAGASIDRDSMKALILTAFSAGTHTTSTTLEWTMAELLRHPRVMKKLQDEVRAVLRGKQEITDDDLEKMLYMKAVIKEAFRFHPALPLLVPRVAREDTKVMGYDIAARTVVIINLWAIGRDPALWDEPEAFRPERFLNSTIDAKGFDFELLPFGAGRRGCPGISFSMAVLELLLASLVQKFDWELPIAGATAKEEEELDMSEAPGVSSPQKNSSTGYCNSLLLPINIYQRGQIARRGLDV